MRTITNYSILHDATRLTTGRTDKLPDIGRLNIGDVISLDEPDARGEYVIIRIARRQAIGEKLVPHVVLRAK